MTGFPHRHMAAILGVSEPTLRKHYRPELALGIAHGAFWTSDRIHKLAQARHWPAMKMLAAVFLDWGHKTRHERPEAGGGPVSVHRSTSEDELRRRPAEIGLALGEGWRRRPGGGRLPRRLDPRVSSARAAEE